MYNVKKNAKFKCIVHKNLAKTKKRGLMADYAQRLLEINNKIFQVLRIKKQLESRRLGYLNSLSSLTDKSQIMIYLNYLENTYKREERVYLICEKGLANALTILGEAESTISETQSVRERLKNTFLKKVPIAGKRWKGEQPLIPLLNMWYDHLKKQIFFFEENFESLRKNIVNQHGFILKAIADVKDNPKDAAIDYGVIAELRTQELEIFKEIEKESKSKAGNLAVIMNRIQINVSQSEKFQRNRGLLSLQAKFVALPISSGGTALISMTLGPQFAPLAYGLLTFVEYSPLLVILLKEGGIAVANQVRGLMPRQPPKLAYA